MNAALSSAQTLLERLRAETAPWGGHSIADPRESGDLTDRERAIVRELVVDPADAEIPLGNVSDLWTGLATEMLDAARRHQANSELIRAVPEEVIVTALDTYLVNAASYSCEDGSALIVLNDALVDLVYEVPRILARLVTVPGETGPDGATDDARRALIAVLDWIRLSGHVHGVDLPLDRPRLRVAFELCVAIEEFIIAHEVAHLVLGHHGGCMGSRQLLIEVPGPAISDPDYQREEIEADGLAILMVLDLRSRRSDHNDQMLALDGARLFFALQAEIERLVLGQRFVSALRVDIAQTHPPAEVRASVMQHALRRGVKNADEAWERSASFTTAFGLLLEGADESMNREQEAEAWVENLLSSCAQRRIPDYATFKLTLATEAPRLQEPLLLATLAAAMVESERSLQAFEARAAAGDAATEDFPLEDWQRLKLLRSYGDSLGIKALRALREMYVRAGGQTLLDDDIARAATPQNENSPVAALLRALGSDKP
jgi:hypothetical protein